MARKTFDRRLVGIWRSDRRRTFRDFFPRRGVSEESIRKLKSLFGKLEVRYGYKVMHSSYDGVEEQTAYELLASDSSSVVIRYYSELFNEHCIRQIHFEDEYMWMAISGGLCEFFRRIPKSARKRSGR